MLGRKKMGPVHERKWSSEEVVFEDKGAREEQGLKRRPYSGKGDWSVLTC